MGANIAKEVADEKFCETTIGNYCKEQTRVASCGLSSPVAGQQENLWRKPGDAMGSMWFPSTAVPTELVQETSVISREFSAGRISSKPTAVSVLGANLVH